MSFLLLPSAASGCIVLAILGNSPILHRDIRNPRIPQGWIRAPEWSPAQPAVPIVMEKQLCLNVRRVYRVITDRR